MENRIDEDTHIEETIKLTRRVQLGISESSSSFSILLCYLTSKNIHHQHLDRVLPLRGLEET